MSEPTILGFDISRGDDRTVIVTGRRNGTAIEIQSMIDVGSRRIKLMQDDFQQYVIGGLMKNMPIKWHRRKRWMSLAYHRRIQKKWNKRFGTIGSLPPIIIDLK